MKHPLLFLDTNVLIDVLAQREPHVEHARAVWAEVESGMARGVVSAVTLTTVWYLTRKVEGSAKARDHLAAMLTIFSVAACDANVVTKALTMVKSDFEDMIQYASAEEISADVIITRNVRHFPKHGIPVIAPAAWLARRRLTAK